MPPRPGRWYRTGTTQPAQSRTPRTRPTSAVAWGWSASTAMTASRGAVTRSPASRSRRTDSAAKSNRTSVHQILWNQSSLGGCPVGLRPAASQPQPNPAPWARAFAAPLDGWQQGDQDISVDDACADHRGSVPAGGLVGRDLLGDVVVLGALRGAGQLAQFGQRLGGFLGEAVEIAEPVQPRPAWPVPCRTRPAAPARAPSGSPAPAGTPDRPRPAPPRRTGPRSRRGR